MYYKYTFSIDYFIFKFKLLKKKYEKLVVTSNFKSN